jgi:uncharacterized protein YkwD
MEERPLEQGNKPHPARHAFSKIGITLFAFVIVVLFLATAFFARTVIQSGQLAAVISSVLVDLTNKDRTQEEIGTLTMSPVLVAAAQAKANDMAEKEYFAHTSPEGIDPWYWMREAGYTFSYAGENLAVNFSDSEDVVSAWMDSPGHRANILNGKFTEIGIATAVGEYKGQKTTFVVQMFGTPRTTTTGAPVREIETPANPEDITVATTEDETEVLGSEVSETPVVTETEIPAVLAQTEPAPRYASDAEILLTSPHNLLRLLYFVCAGIILVALILVTELELRKHHLPHVLAACALFMLMGGLFGVADWFIFTHPIVGQEFALSSGG